MAKEQTLNLNMDPDPEGHRQGDPDLKHWLLQLQPLHKLFMNISTVPCMLSFAYLNKRERRVGGRGGWWGRVGAERGVGEGEGGGGGEGIQVDG